MGLFNVFPIKKRDFIIEYIGEVKLTIFLK